MDHPPHRRLRAPQEDGEALIDPPLSEVPATIAANRASAVNRDAQLGMPPGYCEAARRDLFGQADFQPAASLLMAGHQPTLFHPGVWFKNFLLSSLAGHVGGQAVNLIVDNDTIRTASIKVPRGGASEQRVADVLFDAQGEEIPWERRHLLEPELFRTFDHRVRETLGVRVSAPLLIDRLWPHAMRACEEEVEAGRRLLVRAGIDDLRFPLPTSVRPGRAMAAGRHRVERDVGLVTHEVAVSDPRFSLRFFEFAEVLIGRHQELWAIHNAALANYRQANHIRSRSHPVPELERDGEWYEMPLWIWTHARPHRRRAFVRHIGSSWELTDREGIVITPETLEPTNKMTALSDADARGISIRPRALLTTMYARLVLSDLFIHGIGGAKYDELTDEIVRRLFGMEPPRYLTATATFRLPRNAAEGAAYSAVTPADVRETARRIRDVRYRPESFVGDPLLADDPAIARQLESLAHEKRNYLRGHKLRRGPREVFAGLDRLNRAMHDLLRPVEEHLRREQARLVDEARRSRLLGSREFSFVLFPEDFLVPRLIELSRVPA